MSISSQKSSARKKSAAKGIAPKTIKSIKTRSAAPAKTHLSGKKLKKTTAINTPTAENSHPSFILIEPKPKIKQMASIKGDDTPVCPSSFVTTVKSKTQAEVATPSLASTATPVEPTLSPVSKPQPVASIIPPKEDRVIHLRPPIIVKDLAVRMAIKPFLLISDLMQLKILVSINQPVEPEIARKLCEKHGFKLELERRGEPIAKPTESPKEKIIDQKTIPELAEARRLVARPPVVTIMGHVDHGKTSLLDAIRKANVAAGEAGGITQHMGAYSVAIPSDDPKIALKAITFLDTPGHEAFTAMRARGANITDVVVLVVAANEGLMPQTIEAIDHARAAQVPMIVALTKMDLEASQKMKDRVKKQLQEHDLAPEEWGGKTITVELSATKKTGINQLLEMILLQAELMELKSEQEGPAEGTVIEAQMESGRGVTATVLIRKGTLKIGDALVIGPQWGKVRALVDEYGKMQKYVGPSTPIKIVGLSGIPLAGASFRVVKSEMEARAQSEKEQEKFRTQKLEIPKRITLDDLLSITNDNRKVFNLILKADAWGSCEAIIQTISKLPQDKVRIEIIHTAVGPVTESDVLLASASKALIISFQVKVDNVAAETLKMENVQIHFFRVIYDITSKLLELMGGLLEPQTILTSLGMAEVKQVFTLSKGGQVAGCLVTQGRITRKGHVKVLRHKNVIFEGGISTLRRFQDEANEVRVGLECGIRVSGFNDYQLGDIIEVYHLEKIASKL